MYAILVVHITSPILVSVQPNICTIVHRTGMHTSTCTNSTIVLHIFLLQFYSLHFMHILLLYRSIRSLCSYINICPYLD